MSAGMLVVVIGLGALLAWKIGSVVLRVTGALIVVAGLAGIATDGSGGLLLASLVVLLGTVLWLAGHWLFAFRHHVYRSPLAQQIFLRALPRWLDPTRNWGVHAIDSEGR
jgi:metal-dependent HD superfamily phosphatase/phosphodiesterase